MNTLELLLNVPQWLACEWTPVVFRCFALCFITFAFIEMGRAAWDCCKYNPDNGGDNDG